ncbi:MAG TPA: hypothetical protein VK879_18000 [Candidatus Sulfomarinibacteraceae bacterium]|nr:hypothetical protein [Candidatus Sulfomarinibacteraceae bacterium]
MTRKILPFLCATAIILLAGVFSFITLTRSASADTLAALGNGFTYQGELVDDGQPVDDVCDFQFSLWDDDAGSQIGTTQTSEGVTVAGGRFNVRVNDGNQFGNEAFDGDARWLQIDVRCPTGSGGYTTLDPRQPLTASPYALFATNAASVPWSGITGIPADIADGDDDTTYTAGDGLVLNGVEFELAAGYQLPQSCDDGQAAIWSGSAWLCTDTAYANVIVVAKSGGDYDSIQDALDSIDDAADDNRYLILVAPGVYDERVTMKPYVEIEGAGRELVTITSPGASNNNVATVTGADDAELRNLTVGNSGGDTYAIGIYNNGVAPRLTGLAIVSEGGNNTYGIHNTSGGASWITDARLTATSTRNARAIYHSSTASLTVKDTEATVSGCGNGVCYGIAVIANTTALLENVTANSIGDDSSSPNAVFGSGGATLTLQNVTAYATGGTSNSSALGLANGAGATVRDSVLTADDAGGGTARAVSLNNTGSGRTVSIHHSELYAPSLTVWTNHSSHTINVANTLLHGGPTLITGGSTITCAGVYDENFTFFADTCP